MSETSRAEGRPSSSGGGRIGLAVVAIAAVLVAIVLAAVGNSGAPDRAAGPSDAPQPSPPGGDEGPDGHGTDPLALGEADAPVVMVMYSEFQCPFCGKFARDTEPELVERYVRDGTLRIEWRDLPYLGDESVRAAAAGRAAADQGAFWAFASRLYAEQRPPNSGALSTEYLLDVAADLGLDLDRFRAVMDDEATLRSIGADVDEAVSAGVTGTPAFFVNGEMIFGAQPVEVFVDAIERAAATAR